MSDLLSRFAAHFPITVGDVRVEVFGIDETPDGVVLDVRLTVSDGDEVVSVREQPFKLEVAARAEPPHQWRVERRPLRPDAVDPAALAGHVRHHLGRGVGTTAMPDELFEPPAVWQPLVWAETRAGLAESRVAGEETWEAIDSHADGGSWQLLEQELVPAAERYLRRERGVLFGAG